ncbi:MAG: hypothetical protein ABSE04_04040 [Candidatus Microgenomates bacterium]|jgi:hypothetical protein
MLAELKERFAKEPKIIGFFGVSEFEKSFLPVILSGKLGAHLINNNSIRNPYRGDYLRDPAESSLRFHIQLLVDKVESIKKYSGKSVILGMSFEMDLLEMQAERKLGLISQRDLELYRGVFDPMVEIGAVKKADLGILVDEGGNSPKEKAVRGEVLTYIDENPGMKFVTVRTETRNFYNAANVENILREIGMRLN